MATFAELGENAKILRTFNPEHDPFASDGEFTVAATVLGITYIYVLQGKFEDPDAVIVRRYWHQPGKQTIVYEGDGILGGGFRLTREVRPGVWR
ncbi:hypothetical protein EDF62_3327 [Leucobacter luti]|uniref:Uncharacterized protein n=1 Tax=Leucobacter luti TaxID=340320 RepID=A0A4R6RS74_9MICO|nr:hypothetical protein [Leucobacter luti]TDP89574.1 hypothetical protein EDF62_3327 [Leucobacter luti]